MREHAEQARGDEEQTMCLGRERAQCVCVEGEGDMMREQEQETMQAQEPVDDAGDAPMNSAGGDVWIICVNGCMEIGGHMTWERAKHKAAQAGWMESSDGEPLCPLCAPTSGIWPLGQAPADVRRARLEP